MNRRKRFFEPRTLHAGYEMHEYLLKKYPSRVIKLNPFIKGDTFYYYSTKMRLRIVKNKTEVWVYGDVEYAGLRRRK